MEATLLELAADVADTLEQKNLTASTLQVKVRYSDFTTLTRQTTLQVPVRDSAEIYRAIRHLLKKEKLLVGAIRLLGVSSSNLMAPSGQMELPLGSKKSRDQTV